MFLYIINFGFPLQASHDIRVDRKVALTTVAGGRAGDVGGCFGAGDVCLGAGDVLSWS
jgi:hypothetical protein